MSRLSTVDIATVDRLIVLNREGSKLSGIKLEIPKIVISVQIPDDDTPDEGLKQPDAQEESFETKADINSIKTILSDANSIVSNEVLNAWKVFSTWKAKRFDYTCEEVRGTFPTLKKIILKVVSTYNSVFTAKNSKKDPLINFCSPIIHHHIHSVEKDLNDDFFCLYVEIMKELQVISPKLWTAYENHQDFETSHPYAYIAEDEVTAKKTKLHNDKKNNVSKTGTDEILYSLFVKSVRDGRYVVQDAYDGAGKPERISKHQKQEKLFGKGYGRVQDCDKVMKRTGVLTNFMFITNVPRKYISTSEFCFIFSHNTFRLRYKSTWSCVSWWQYQTNKVCGGKPQRGAQFETFEGWQKILSELFPLTEVSDQKVIEREKTLDEMEEEEE